MKFVPMLALLLVAGVGGGARAETLGNAIDVDGEVHRLLMENEFFRIFDARASAGTKSPMHRHEPMVLVSLGKARFRVTTPDGKTTLLDLNPGQAFWVQSPQHSWELLTGELHVVGVEIKSAQGGAEPVIGPRPDNDAAKIDPDVHHVLFENPHVRVFEGRATMGRKSPMHSHPPTLLISLDWIRLKLTLPDGKTAIHDFRPGEVQWLGQGGTHSWEAIAGSGRVIAIEVKAAQAARAN